MPSQTRDAEEAVRRWIEEFTGQIQMVDQFYQDTRQEFVNKFMDIQAKYLKKLQVQQSQTGDAPQEELSQTLLIGGKTFDMNRPI